MKMATQSLLNPMAINYLYWNQPNKDMSKLIDLTGKTFGRLKVISYSHVIPHPDHPAHFWNCTCVCGNTLMVRGSNLKKNHTKSCGCLQSERAKKANTIHGESDKTKEFNAWGHVLARCLNKNNKNYLRYGGRGITVCERWRNSYENFLADMGRAPSAKHSIDRIDNDGNYEPTNCKWSTKKEQANNRRSNNYIHYNGDMKTLSQWCDQLNMKYHRVRDMLYSGRSIEYTFNYQQKL